MIVFLLILFADRVRKNLLKYCELDTFAMVKIFEYLKDVVKE